MKRFLTISILCILCLCLPLSVQAEEESDASLSDTVLTPNYIVVGALDPTVVFFESNADERSIPGSTMKIMTCILTLENAADLEETVAVTAQAASLKETNSLMGAMTGEELTVRELLYGLMLESGNDAALTLALHIGGTLESFVDMMNAKAAELGMQNTHFINASGAYKRDQYSTPRDMAVLACYAMQNDLFRQIVSTPYYTISPNNVRKRPLDMVNGNKLIVPDEKNALYDPEAIGVKTGSTENGGKCLVAAAQRNGRTVISVLLGAKEGGSKNARMNRVFQDAQRLMQKALDEGYGTYTAESLGLSYQTDMTFLSESIPVSARFSDEEAFLPVEVADAIQADPTVLRVEETADPAIETVTSGQTVGTAVFYYHEQPCFTAQLVAEASAQTPTPLPVRTPDPVSVEDDTKERESTQTAGSAMPVMILILVAVLIGITVLLLLLLPKRKRRKRRRKR